MNSNSSSEQKSGMKINDLYNMKQIIQVAIRPSTDEIFYILNQANKSDNGYRNTVWRFKDKERQFTQGLPSDTSMKWSPCGSKLAFLSIRSVPKKGSKKDAKPSKPQIFIIYADGGEALQLTNMPTGVTSFEWSNDGSKIVFISRLNKEELSALPEEQLKELDSEEIVLINNRKKNIEEKKIEPRIITREVYRSGTSFFDDRKGQIHVIDLESKEVTRWTNNLEDDYQIAYLSNDHNSVYTARKKPGEGDETRNWELLKISSDGTVKVIVKDHYSWTANFEISQNEKYIATTMGKRDLGTLGQEDVVVYSIKTGKRTILATEIDNNKYGVKFSFDSKKIFFIVPEKGISAIWQLDLDSSKLTKIVEGDFLLVDYDLSNNGEWLAFHAFHVNDPTRLYRFSLETKELELIVEPNKEFLKSKLLGTTEEVWYNGANGDFKIQGWILTPPKFDSEKKYPLAVNMHGGPHVMWSNHQSIPMFHEFQLLASEGYVVFYCNPRGSDGYGQEFYKACEKKWGDDDSVDVLNGVDLVVDRGFVNKKKMGITGGSYAGFLTAWIIGHDNRFAAAVPQRGVYFLSSFWASTDGARVLIDDEFGTTPLGDHAFLWERSPAAYAKNITTPTRIIHSDLDFRAPIPDAEMLYTALKREQPDLDVEFIRYPSEGHELSRSGQPSRRLDRLAKIIEWFDKYCQPKKFSQKQKQAEKITKLKTEFREKMYKKIKELKKP